MPFRSEVAPTFVTSYSPNNKVTAAKLGQKFLYLVLCLMVYSNLNYCEMSWPSIVISKERSPLPHKCDVPLFQTNAHISVSNGHTCKILVSIYGFSITRKPMEPFLLCFREYLCIIFKQTTRTGFNIRPIK